jgi:hypothetical protein
MTIRLEPACHGLMRPISLDHFLHASVTRGTIATTSPGHT